MTAGTLTQLSVRKIRRDGGTQMRDRLDRDAVIRYAEVLDSDGELEPIVVFYDGENYWLADGFMRLAAHFDKGRAYIDADVRSGTRRDAILHACGANAAHGLPRTRADAARAVRCLLEDPEWCRWSDREIGRRAGVHPATVAKHRAEMVNQTSAQPDGMEDSSETAEPTPNENPAGGTKRTVKRGNTIYEMDTSGLKKPKPTPPPEPSHREPAPVRSEIGSGGHPRWLLHAQVALDCLVECELNLQRCPGSSNALMQLEKAIAAIKELISNSV